MENSPQSLLKVFQQNHIAILSALDDITQAISSSLELTRKQYLTIKPAIRSLQNCLLNYLQHQNQSFYDALSQQPSSKDLSKTLDFLAQDLKDFKIKTLIFFDEFPADMGDLNPRNFKSFFHIFSAQVINRLQAEKDLLFPLLEK